MMSASLNRCKGMEDQVGDFLKQLAAKLELVLLHCLNYDYLNICTKVSPIYMQWNRTNDIEVWTKQRVCHHIANTSVGTWNNQHI